MFGGLPPSGPSKPLTKKQVRRNQILVIVGATLFTGALLWAASGRGEDVTGTVIETRISSETRGHITRPIACLLRAQVDAGVVRFMFLSTGIKECSLLREGDLIRLIGRGGEGFWWIEADYPAHYTGRLEP